MSELVRFEKRGAIGLITVDNPPVNALSPGVPEGIGEALAAGNADADVTAMVLIGAGRSFIAGADIRHLGKGGRPGLTQQLLEGSEKPMVAAIHGHALGGGLEIALACHYRVAAKSARVGLPEVLIGILPGGGGTQRLPRLIGVAPALDMIVSGRHVPAPEARELGVLDEVVEDDQLLSAALTLAQKVSGVRPLRRVSDMQDKLRKAEDEATVFEAMRKRIARSARGQRAPFVCIEAVEAAVNLPFEEGVKRERELFQAQVNTDEAKALRYAFFAEREAQKVPLPKDTPITDVHSVAIIGGGTMGGGIAMACADAGVPVRILEMDEDALNRALGRIGSTYDVSVKRGSLSEAAVRQRTQLISGVSDYAAIGNCDMVIEAVFEEMGVKKEVFAKIDSVMKPGAILATNTSALDVDEIAAATKRPQDVIGTHFFSPANVMKLLEIVRGAKTSPQVIASTSRLAKRLGKIGVVCGNCDGFVANRSRAPFVAEANYLVEEGALPEQIDKVLTDFGYRMGVFAVADLAGGDISYAGRKRRQAQNPDYRSLPIADRLVEMGRLGQKSGAGWYKYEHGDRTPHPDPEVARVITEVRRELGINARQIGEEEILRRMLLASVNEACKIVEEGIATRGSDVDVMWLHGFNFPRFRGGLMYWADQIGAHEVHEQLRAWESELGPRWRPAALLRRLAEKGERFTDATA